MFESSPTQPTDETSALSPAILYFDPNPTTSKLVTAGLRLAGYTVHRVLTEQQAVEVCRVHGPGGDGSVAALLLDAATDPPLSASILRALLRVPGGSDLPGVLLISRANPKPIPGAEALPSVKRPFTTPALLKVLREALESAPTPAPETATASHVSDDLLGRVKTALSDVFTDIRLDRGRLERFTSVLLADSALPKPRGGVAVTTELSTLRLESLLTMLGSDGTRGVLTIERASTRARLHLDNGAIRMGEIENSEEDLRLGRFAVEAGLLTTEQVDVAAREADAGSQRLGQRLAETGLIRGNELSSLLLKQAHEVTCHLLTWQEGQAYFSPLSELHPLAAAASKARKELRVSEVLLDGLRRRDETAQQGPEMPRIDDIFVRVDDAVAKMGRHAFTRDELGVLELLNGRNSIKDISRKTRSGTFAIAKIVFRLMHSSLARRRLAPVEV